MPKQRTDHLVELVKTMSKAEKRSFRLFVNRESDAKSKLFYQLFEVLDKTNNYDENQILSKISRLKKSQLSNVKANLYQQLLNCLRQIKRKQVDEIQIRELIDYAKILYDKGIYKAALEILDKAKRMAIDINYETLVMSIIYFEKRVESQHITRAFSNRAEDLSKLSNHIIDEMKLTNSLSNLSLLLYEKYLQFGYVKSEKEYEYIQSYFEETKPVVQLAKLNFYQSLYYFQSFVWFYNMTQNFAQYYKYSQRWLDLFHKNPDRKFSEIPLYIKSIHNVLNALFMAQKEHRFNEVFQELQSFDITSKSNVTINEISNHKLILSIHRLNGIFLSCDYKNGVNDIEDLEQEIEDNIFNWDLNRMMVFYYKLGCVHFGAEDCDKALYYLNKINNVYYPGLRGDIQSFSRILALIVHFDLGNEELVSYQLRQVYRFLLKLEELDAVFTEILHFLRRTPKMDPNRMLEEFYDLKRKLLIVEQKRFEKRPFLYLDIISWLDTKIMKKSFQQVLMEKKLVH